MYTDQLMASSTQRNYMFMKSLYSVMLLLLTMSKPKEYLERLQSFQGRSEEEVRGMLTDLHTQSKRVSEHTGLPAKTKLSLCQAQPQNS